MGNNSFAEKVCRVDWAKFLEPEYYNPDKMAFEPDKLVEALILLNRGDESKAAFGLAHEIRSAIGNDHRGTYYPAALEAIDFIIEVEKYSGIEAARKCARDVLNDLYYFQLELGSDDKELYEAIDSVIKEKLQPYADENIMPTENE